jgi:outer membrane protein OmpA-like peptidoglycan-associated protein
MMVVRLSLTFGFAVCFMSLCMNAQEVIKLQNPSFEDLPRKGGEFSSPIRGWHDCGLAKFPSETPPDIHPVPATAWEVSKLPYDGETFLGMVTRYNDTYESLSQALSTPIMGGTCYSFSAFIARSELYKSATGRSRDELENFVKPAVFMIWGGNSFCDKAELLGESPAVSNSDWKMYKFTFQPKKTHKYITIEAFYKTPILEAYNGHILVDKLSDIVPVDCPVFPEDLVADVSDPPAKVVPAEPIYSGNGKSTKPSPPPSTKNPVSKPPPFTANLLPELENNKVVVGQKIRLNFLYFKADSINLLPDSYKVLDELAAYLKAYPKTIIEIGGHTNTIASHDYSMDLSTSRAKSVQQYLINKGISESRLQYKGYGKTEPLFPNDKYNKEWKFKNQRVEIKILAVS